MRNHGSNINRFSHSILLLIIITPDFSFYKWEW